MGIISIFHLKPECVALLWRSWEIFVHDFRGTTTWALVLWVLVSGIIWWLKRLDSTLWQWRAAVRDACAAAKRSTIATVTVYALFFLISIYRAYVEKPTFTEEQIVAYANGIIVGITGVREADALKLTKDAEIVRSGFWINTNRLMLSYVRQSPDKSNFLLYLLMRQSSLSEQKVFGFNGAIGQFLKYDPSTGITVYLVEKPPFETFNDEGQMAFTDPLEPFISTNSLTMGDEVYMPWINQRRDKPPTIEMAKGYVKGYWPGFGFTRDRRLSVSIPFKPIYAGLPVFNSSKEIVGIVGDSESDCSVIPAAYICEILKRAEWSSRNAGHKECRCVLLAFSLLIVALPTGLWFAFRCYRNYKAKRTL